MDDPVPKSEYQAARGRGRGATRRRGDSRGGGAGKRRGATRGRGGRGHHLVDELVEVAPIPTGPSPKFMPVRLFAEIPESSSQPNQNTYIEERDDFDWAALRASLEDEQPVRNLDGLKILEFDDFLIPAHPSAPAVASLDKDKVSSSEPDQPEILSITAGLDLKKKYIMQKGYVMQKGTRARDDHGLEHPLIKRKKGDGDFEAIKTASFPLTNTTEFKVRCVESERKALLSFKRSLTDPSDRLASWVGKECCIWKAVYCDIQTGYVIGLDLNDRSNNCYWKKLGHLIPGNSTCFGGKISPALLELRYLKHLDLGGNDFQGLATPNFLGSLENLQYLNLSLSSLVGIPPSFGNLSNLRYLNLWAYSYPIDTVERSWVKDLNWVSGLSSLKYIDLSYVNLSLVKHWLEAFNKLPSLVTLRLQSCSLHYHPYSFPNWNMTSLSYLSLSQNNFVNFVLPKWLSNATTVEVLYITFSNIQGPISNVEWGKLCNLRQLSLTQNKINGDISRIVEGLSSCSNKTIEVLYLGQNALTGQLPNSLGHLKNIRILVISFNLISGAVPASIEQLTRLEKLDMGENQLSGPLPESIFNFSELTFLGLTTNYALEGNLGQNHFARFHGLTVLSLSCGRSFSVNLTNEWVPPFSLTYIELRSCSLGPKFPTWLETQKQLQFVILTNGSISDPIPPWLWTLCSQLQWLDLSDNQIGGSLPRLVNFPSTSQNWTVGFYFSYYYGVVVDLSSNRFHGLLPLWPNVTHLSLAKNLFSGSIPLNIGHVMTKLQVLDLSRNAFIGSIPYSITRVNKLLRLDLSDNHLSGKIPDWWYESQQLQVIDLSGNNFTGGIPPTICSPPSLFWLRLSRNNLFGELPKSLSNCKSLLALDIGENKISGTIPEWFGESLLSLQILRMTHNMIDGCIPPQLCQLSSLQILDLSHNHLTGFIPSCLGSLRGLKSTKFYKWFPNYFYFSYVFTPNMELVEKGTKRTYTVNLDQVNLIDLSCNNLHGEIPNEITGLSDLGNLNLSGNQLSGKIPKDIGSMQLLETLDLSSNHLSGSIPLSMTSITSLSHLNLSYNNLGGPIPSTNQFGTFTDPSCFEGVGFVVMFLATFSSLMIKSRGHIAASISWRKLEKELSGVVWVSWLA
ncbi:receptor-like protein EIX2 [Lycium ferocissimum]|uniref:receptor-like protein EIX2 n=1 Tax=Lycium ferocissimum TaxID=112874 RepID=UPI0028161803|nr:receptor-like protein EIX2 [Lycium ferocissimum]